MLKYVAIWWNMIMVVSPTENGVTRTILLPYWQGEGLTDLGE